MQKDKQHLIDQLMDNKEKIKVLSEGGYIRPLLNEIYFDKTIEKIDNSSIEELQWGKWPPLYLFICQKSISEIKEFENDLNLVINFSNSKNISRTTNFLKAEDYSDWFAGIFEIHIKSRLLKENNLKVDLDFLLPNGREIDIRMDMSGKPFCLECTMIRDSDEDKEVWDRFIEAKKVDPNTSLCRPGSFDPENPKGPSYAYNCLRFYDKVYDKLTMEFDPTKSQVCDSSPNLLLISFYTPNSHLSPTDTGVGWALGELFEAQPIIGQRKGIYQSKLEDISLTKWLHFKEEELIKQSRRRNYFPAAIFNELIAAPRKIGGVLLFEYCSFETARINYNANEQNRISHNEMANLEKLFRSPPVWFDHQLIKMKTSLRN